MENSDNTYYDILKCDTHASFEEIKANYHKLIKVHHPDKKGDSKDTFLKLYEAWETLSDSEKRKKYDSVIFNKANGTDIIIFEEISLRDQQFNDDGLFCYPCRCGSSYTVHKDFLDTNDKKIIVECEECSLALVVNILDR